MPSATDNPVGKEEVFVVEIEPTAEVFHETVNSAIPFLLKCIRYIINLLKRVGRLWMDYYPPIFGVIILPSPLKFITIGLAAFAEMKSQGSEFPFKTHPRSMNVAVTSLLVYGLASAAEHSISATRLGPASVYTMVAHSGRIGIGTKDGRKSPFDPILLYVSVACHYRLSRRMGTNHVVMANASNPFCRMLQNYNRRKKEQSSNSDQTLKNPSDINRDKTEHCGMILGKIME
ncbi:hypothetical protein L2E82_47694 [Cichorium intybus]|uniref:Uncharacterized protein n=1 Tax=Cichorium intybus TaxID=13427 RepID=A0ACB8YWG0_CICIN|nr:hypothetical protein L2E82_47694 [Cichorium intybus]